jgi:hypothetical protein
VNRGSGTGDYVGLWRHEDARLVQLFRLVGTCKFIVTAGLEITGLVKVSINKGLKIFLIELHRVSRQRLTCLIPDLTVELDFEVLC